MQEPFGTFSSTMNSTTVLVCPLVATQFFIYIYLFIHFLTAEGGCLPRRAILLKFLYFDESIVMT